MAKKPSAKARKANEEAVRQSKLDEKYGKPLAQIAINWSTQKSFVTTALTGVRNVREAEENCATFAWELAQEDIDLLDSELERLGITEATS